MDFGMKKMTNLSRMPGKLPEDFLWQVDIDEFYKPGDMTAVINMIQEDPSISLDYLSEIDKSVVSLHDFRVRKLPML
jgi:hypothetical protein